MIMTIRSLLRNVWKDEKGVTTLEYGILAAGVAVIIGTIVSTDGVFYQTLEELFDRVLDSLPSTTSESS